MKTICKFILLSALLGLFSQSALADDGDCDILTDATPGLFGLCTAYCEAQSCDSYEPGEEPRSCNRLLANYDKKKTDSDPNMPCLAEEAFCPCWGLDEQAAALNLVENGIVSDAGCTLNTGTGLAEVTYFGFEPPVVHTIWFQANTDGMSGSSTCLYVSSFTDDALLMNTDEEQDAVCRAGIEALQMDHMFCL